MSEIKNGYITLHRKIRDHWVYKDPDHFKVFITMLMDANHADKTVVFNGVKVRIKRGQFVFGRKAYSQKTGVSEAKIRNQLNSLVNDQVITIRPTSRYSLVTLVSYDLHQLSNQPNTSPTTSSTTTPEKVKNLNI